MVPRNLVTALLPLVCAPLALAQTAYIALINGHVITVDPRQPRAEALAIQGDRILAVGTNVEIRALTHSGTEVIDLQGHTVVPGLVDGHLHFAGLGADRGHSLDLGEAMCE